MDRRGLITAIRTLTALPVRGKDAPDFSDSLFFFPWVGFLLGLISWAAGSLWVCFVGPTWAAGGAVLLIGLQILLTRGLHLDGVADLADALGAAREREKRLRIMKDPHVGSFGVVAIAFDLLAKWAALERLFQSGGLLVVVPVFLISRGVMVALMARLPYAREDEGMARPFLQNVSRGKERMAGGISLFLCLFFGPAGVVLFVAGGVIARVLVGAYRRGFGGITGDLLGTANECVEIVLLWSCAFAGEGIRTYLRWDWTW
jgi:adenosylcobinamide-GDP ribazoletransferase